MKLGFLDRMVATVSPQTALKRARARLALNHITMHFDGAAKSYRTKNWRAQATDANAASIGQLGRLRNVSRDLVRNNPLALRGKTVVVNSVIGAGIVPSVTARPRRKDVVRDLVARHLETTAIDADGRHDLYGLQALAVGGMYEGGEVLIRRRRRRAADGLPLSFQIQVLEADYLDETKTGPMPGGNIAIQGVEFDQIGRRVAYWLYDSHPLGITGIRLPQSKRVPASEIIHLYRMDRPGQVRGVPWLAPVIVSLNDFWEFKDAQLMRQKIAACFAAFIEDADADGSGSTPTTDTVGGKPIEELGPGIIETLPAGKKITFAEPPELGDFASYNDATARDIAIGIGVTFEALTGNLREVNFTSGRMGRIDMDANVDAWRWLTVIPQFCNGLARWFKEAVAVETFSTEPFSMAWTPPRRPLVDPTKEIPALVREVRAGFSSRQRKIRELGFDPEEVMAEIVADNTFADQNDMIFDSDARRVTSLGQAQDANTGKGGSDAE